MGTHYLQAGGLQGFKDMGAFDGAHHGLAPPINVQLEDAEQRKVPFLEQELLIGNAYHETGAPLVDERLSDWVSQGVVQLPDRQPSCLAFMRFAESCMEEPYPEYSDAINRYALQR
jgi:hypothetical protein